MQPHRSDRFGGVRSAARTRPTRWKLPSTWWPKPLDAILLRIVWIYSPMAAANIKGSRACSTSLPTGPAGGGCLPRDRFRGVAAHKCFGTYVGQVAEVSLTDGAVKIEKITCAVDCGIAVNPDLIRAQMEGGIGYGLGAAMRNKITFTDGDVDQSNFHNFEPLHINDIGDIEVHIVPSAEAPTGVGEPGLPPALPAVANAIYAATGRRLFEMPWSDYVDFA